MSSIGIYIHIPFCDGKCAYCDFFSLRADLCRVYEYTDNLIRLIEVWGKKINRTVDTVYFGGGTPSLLGHERLIGILNAVYRHFDVTDNAEITAEVNPSSTNELDFSAMRHSGFNRLSIGLQSADDSELRLLGRRHTVENAQRTVKRAQNAGFDNISLDVILAIPGQTKNSLDRTLSFCAGCGVQHISSYILQIEEGTRLYDIKDNLNLFSDEEQAELYLYAAGRLSDLGYTQYEISNFSKKGYESRHNLRYWRDEEYLGLGPSAHSFIDGKRFYYDRDFVSFYDNQIISEGSGGDSEEYIMLALRLREGLIFKKYEERYHRPVSKKLIAAAEQLQKNGLCIVNDKSVSLTVKGFLVSNSVIGYLSENS